MNRPLLLVASLSIMIALPTQDASAQSGWVHLRTHLATDHTGLDDGVSRTFEQSGSGMVETFTLAYAPGSHTLAQVETHIGPCRATATNVAFTIVANQWTEVDVPVTMQDCSFQIVLSGWDAFEVGTGTVSVQAGSTTVQQYGICTVARDPAHDNRVFWADFHACQATVPFGTTFHTNAVPDGNSGAASISNGMQLADVNVSSPDIEFSSNFQKYYGDSSYSTDLSIRRVRSSIGGQVMSSTFEIVNRGPNIASEVDVHFDNLIAPQYGEGDNPPTIVFIGSDGRCNHFIGIANRCEIQNLGIGDSTSVTVRIDGVPSQSFTPTNTPKCDVMEVTSQRSTSDGESNRPADTDPSNNSVACASDAVPVVIALGGSTPSSHTVSVGSTNVPMIEFTLTPTSAQTVNSVTIAATGSGNEQVDVTAVKLYVDKNANGQVDAGDSAIASSTFAANDGTVTMNVDPAYSISAPTSLLVTYDFSLTVAQRLGGGLTLAMFPLLLIPAVWRRKRVAALLVMAMIATAGLTACGSDKATGPPGGGSSVTFQSSLTNVNISGTDIASPLAGATITIDK